MNKLSFIDSIISFISPKWAAERMAWRSALTGYDSGNLNRGNDGWIPATGTAEQIAQGERTRIRARARDLERNSDIANAVISAFERNVIGAKGFILQAKAKDQNGNELTELNKEIEERFKNWCKAKNCDITGVSSFKDFQKMIIRRLIVDGGLIFIKVYTKDGFKLQAREVDDLDNLMMTPKENGNRIINGVEIDDTNKPIAYHFAGKSLDGLIPGKPERIPASRVLFIFKSNTQAN